MGFHASQHKQFRGQLKISSFFYKNEKFEKIFLMFLPISLDSEEVQKRTVSKLKT